MDSTRSVVVADFIDRRALTDLSAIAKTARMNISFISLLFLSLIAISIQRKSYKG
jgi:hypothetical protein